MSDFKLKMDVGELETAVDASLSALREHNILQRIREHDHTVWQEDPTEITNRLGWLDIADRMVSHIVELEEFAAGVKADGIENVLLLGMGGSSLAPELFSYVYGDLAAGLNLFVLDSTDPGYVLDYAHELPPAKTLYIVATKSGGTAETLSGFKYFYNVALEALGRTGAGEHFVAITDPGSKLIKLANRYRFRHTFVNDPNIGGRYSALSYFGLVPAALVGVDLGRLLDSAVQTAKEDEAAAQLGSALGALAQAGRDKLTLVTPERLSSFGDWAEQLIAESTGKRGTGILPVVGEPLGGPNVYGADRIFVHIALVDDDPHAAAIATLREAGHPVITLTLADVYALAGQFWLWEMATAVAGHVMGIQPFNQPNVESAKNAARAMIAAYQEAGKLPEAETSPLTKASLEQFLKKAEAGDYISIHAYIHPTGAAKAALAELQAALRDKTKLATTVGFGPRFLHSTGQLHKGDAGNGLFVQFVSDVTQDAPIPDTAGQEASSMSFNVLKTAQALGDAQALQENERRLIRFHTPADAAAAIRQLL